MGGSPSPSDPPGTQFVLVPKAPPPPPVPVVPYPEMRVPSKTVVINLKNVTEGSFFPAFAEAFGCPRIVDWLGWEECMISLESRDAGIAKVHAPPGGVLVLELHGVEEFRVRCPVLFLDLLMWCSQINFRALDLGGGAYLCVAFPI